MRSALRGYVLRVTSAPETQPKTGIVASVKRAAGHAGALARLQRELATTELQRKGGALGAAGAAGVGAAVLGLFALGFGLATVAVALAIVLDAWLALLIVCVALILAAVALALVARSLVRASTPLKPEQAIAEAQRTKEVLGRS